VAEESVAACSQKPCSGRRIAALGATALLQQAREAGYDLIALSRASAAFAAGIVWNYRDPLELINAGVARAKKLAIVSPDTAFDAIGVPRT
jgi:PIN domain nuclease of toxin-antitoxin system